MIIRQLQTKDAKQFSKLIVNMYEHLQNLEWFTPMPYDIENVIGMIENPRFYIVGAFIRNKLVGVSSLDYKCGKLIGKVDFPKECDTNKLVEIGFTIVHFNYRGRKIMQQLLDYLLEKIKSDGFTWAFAKIHKDNLASSTSCIRKGFYVFSSYAKPVKKTDLQNLASQDFFSPEGKANLAISLQKFPDADEIIVDYRILVKPL